MAAPQRADVLEVIDRLLAGDISREEASAWAGDRHFQAAPDLAVEEALDVLTLIDARHVAGDGRPLGYLYDFAEIAASREALIAGSA